MKFVWILPFFYFFIFSCADKPHPQTQPVCLPERSDEGTTTEVKPERKEHPLIAWDYHALHRQIDSAILVQDTVLAISLLRTQIQNANNLDEIGTRSMQLATLLKQQGRIQEAEDVLEAFLVYKPRLMEWLDSAEKMEQILRGESVKAVQDIQPLLKQISNIMATSADYSTIRTWTDSLRDMEISDSLRRWSFKQDSLALKRTCIRIVPQVDSIRKWIVDEGNFKKATDRIAVLKQLRIELVREMKFDSIELWARVLEEKEKQNEDPRFWKGKDPNQVIAEARKLRAAGNLDKSIVLYRKLVQTSLRKQAYIELNGIGEEFCQKKRQIASDAYAKSRKQSGVENSALMEKAVGALRLCLDEFPGYSAANKVSQNLDMLMKEMEQK